MGCKSHVKTKQISHGGVASFEQGGSVLILQSQNNPYYLSMKIKTLAISLILFGNLAHAASEEKQIYWVNECITNTPNNISYARAVEYCGCVTRKLMDRFTERQIDNSSAEDLAQNKLMSEIVEECNAVNR